VDSSARALDARSAVDAARGRWRTLLFGFLQPRLSADEDLVIAERDAAIVADGTLARIYARYDVELQPPQ
jgi:hypothetical protein